MRQLLRSMFICVLAAGLSVQAFAACPAAPSLIAPANGSEVPFGNVTLDWSDDAFAASYDVYFGLNQDPPSLQGNTTQSQKTIFMEPGYSLTWFVKAKAPTCTDIASSTSTFSTSCPTQVPNLIAPSAGATFPPNQTVNFNWTAVPGTTGYDVELFDGNTWNLLAENITPTSFATVFEVEGDYLWKIRANFNGACDPAYSEMRELVIGTECQTSGPPELISPDDTSTSTLPVTFEWTPRDGATGYTLFVHKIGDRLPRVLTRTQNFSYTTDELEAGTFEWWVAAGYDNCPDAESASRFVTIETTCPTGRATLLQPAHGATGVVNPVTFRWTAVPDAVGYVVGASIDGELRTLGTTTATDLTATIGGSEVTWGVRAIFGEECSTTSELSSFRMQGTGPVCPTPPPTLMSPANGANVRSPVLFSWQGVPGAERYFLVVALGTGDFQPYGSTTDTSIEKFVPPGAVRWAVVATFENCPELRSVVQSFTVSEPDCPAATITLTGPANGATVNSPVRLTWTAVANAEAYRVWVSVNGGAPANILRALTNEATISLPAGQIRWYIEALRPNCGAVLSNTGEFRVAQGTNCAINLPPGLVAPAGTNTNPTNVTSPVTLQWTGVERAIGYRVWVGRNGAFSDVKLTRETSAVVQLEPGVYGWFVQALFEGCDPRNSATAFFRVAETTPRCTGHAPTILQPAQGATPESPVTFRWTKVARANKYRVFASLNGAEPLLLGITTGDELTRPLPPGTVLWSVEAVFDECPSTFSSRVQFTIPRAQNCSTVGTNLVAPANGSTVTGAVDFTWSAVSGAVKYVLVVRVNDGAPTPVTSTSDTHFRVENPPLGDVEWWVITFFAGCDPVDSAHGRFTVTRPENCDNRRPILLIPRDKVPSPVSFQWTRVPRATGYKLWVQQGEDAPTLLASTTEPAAEVELPEGTYIWYVDAEFAGCPPTRSASGEFEVTPPVACGTPAAPEAQVVGQTISNTEYRLRWTPLPNVDFYEVQESTTPDFASAQTFTTRNTSMAFVHQVTGNPVQYLYRVRGVSDCSDDRGPYSDAIGVFIIAPRTNSASAEIGVEANVVQTIFLPGATTPTTFSATADKPWLTVTPASGNLPAEGITLTVTADPKVLALGTNTGTIRVQYTAAAAKAGDPVTHATTPTSIPLSVSLVTPVIPTGKGTPPPDSLIFPIVGHALGINNSLFESDIRVTNLTAQTMKYQLNFTPSGVDGTQVGSSSTIELAPSATLAMDDIVASLFGTGTVSSATGMLEVRPLTTSSSSSSLLTPVLATSIKQLQTAASSRTYNFTPTGTFGQYIPAIRFSDFVGKAASGSLPTILSLQQVSQSTAYRANFGFAEASGNAAELMVRVYDTANQLLATIPIALQAGEHRQINGMLAANGINNLNDGRVEVEVTNGTGKVTAYVSSVDNKTNDPLLVSPVVKGAVSANRYVVPGTAYINSGFVFWVTDLRVFNSGSTATPATLTFYPQGNPGGAVSRQVTINAGEIEVLDNVIGDLFAQPNGAGGMVVITTPTNTNLTATARTYNKTTNGTYGQYIPGVTPAQSIGNGDRALQLLQLEQSSRFRTNVGLAETTGQPVTVDVALIVPDSKVTPVVTIQMAANEFRQISLADFGLGSALYNARVSVKVVGGAGRVTAYGSSIDLTTQDPTYVPAQ